MRFTGSFKKVIDSERKHEREIAAWVAESQGRVDAEMSSEMQEDFRADPEKAGRSLARSFGYQVGKAIRGQEENFQCGIANPDAIARANEIDNNRILLGSRMKMGDWFLFQILEGEEEDYAVLKPQLAIFLGYDVWDQAIACYYVSLKSKDAEPVGFGEWTDYMRILGTWRFRPPFRELRHAYQNAILG
jgi:hypothetical protein